MGLTKQGERIWTAEELSGEITPFQPIALRVCNPRGRVVDTVNASEGFSIELEYNLSDAISGLRVGLYIMTTRGEYVFTTFDTDNTVLFESYPARPAGRYISQCQVPPNLMNEGRFILGVNASVYRIKRFFQDDKALTFTVDATGAPGMHWPEKRLGPVRPKLDWKIEAMEK
jgi:lipopolysaccharide transport system ATP-binding protein